MIRVGVAAAKTRTEGDAVIGFQSVLVPENSRMPGSTDAKEKIFKLCPVLSTFNFLESSLSLFLSLSFSKDHSPINASFLNAKILIYFLSTPVRLPNGQRNHPRGWSCHPWEILPSHLPAEVGEGGGHSLGDSLVQSRRSSTTETDERLCESLCISSRLLFDVIWNSTLLCATKCRPARITRLSFDVNDDHSEQVHLQVRLTSMLHDFTRTQWRYMLGQCSHFVDQQVLKQVLAFGVFGCGMRNGF